MPNDRFIINKAEDGTWEVLEVFTNLPVEVRGVPMIGMQMEEADDMVDLLNTLDRRRRAKEE